MAAGDQSVLVLLNGPYKGSGQEEHWESISGNTQNAPNKTKPRNDINKQSRKFTKSKNKSLIWYVS